MGQSSFDMKRMSMGTKGLAATAALLFIDLFLPWEKIGGGEFAGIEIPSASVSGTQGIGILVLILAIAVLVWEGLFAFGVNINLGTVSPAMVAAILGGATVIFGLIRALIALTRSGTGPSFGLWIGLILLIAMAYAAYVRFSESKSGMAGPAMPPPPPPAG